MDHQHSASLEQFNNLVSLKFQRFNSLFTTDWIEETGLLLSLLSNKCEEGFKNKKSPVDIIEGFFSDDTSYKDEKEQLDLLFRFVRYAERQVVLFDALEDSAFTFVNDLDGDGSLKQLEATIFETQKQPALARRLENFSVRIVLTAHPTQFYPDTVLGIINDLSKAITENKPALINAYLQQLAKTPFFKKQKPTPYDEAVSLIWYLENVFYPAAGEISDFLKSRFSAESNSANQILRMGFWPGGDRDGNPYVTKETTLQVANALRTSIIKCYYRDVRELKKRLTFEGVYTALSELEKRLYDNVFIPGNKTELGRKEILETLNGIRHILIEKHDGLFLDQVTSLMNKVDLFGLYFATLDVRQESSVHEQVLMSLNESNSFLPENYPHLKEEQKIQVLCDLETFDGIETSADTLEKDTVETMKAVRTIQRHNGEEGCNRYIISQCNSALNVIEVLALLKVSGWKSEEINIDIVPLFETVTDLESASEVMRRLYENKTYLAHLKRRGMRQTIMVGFSDGTKDGGYLMANWGIYKAKENLTAVSKERGIDVIFFDGRGGPAARGGGKTHNFYASLGTNIANNEIQLTVQGQTISSLFGTRDAAQFNLEQLINAGISSAIFTEDKIMIQEADRELLQMLADESLKAYVELKNHPSFLDYLSSVSPLQFYSDTNIGSRPSKRGGASKLALKDLRAIPFVSAWSQIKQNVPGFYGLGKALQKADETGRFQKVKYIYENSLYFKTLIENCEMAMKKSFFPLTFYLSDHPQYGGIWKKIYEEYELTQRYLYLLSGKEQLMAGDPVESLSIEMREKIVLPLATIQQYALIKMRGLEQTEAQEKRRGIFGKLAMRCSFGIINAARNSA